MNDFRDELPNLCSRCRTIPLEAYFDHPTERIETELGTFQEIFSKRQDCPFCFLITEAFYGYLHRDWEPGKHPNQICYLRVGKNCDESNAPLASVYFNVTSETMPAGSFGSYTFLGFIGLASQGGISYRLPGDGLLDCGLVRSWIQDCDHEHEKCRATSGVPPNDQIGLWLVDVHDMCLVKRDWSCRYLALSYVWGGITALRAQKSNFAYLQQPGSLESLFTAMPQVIRDAIEFVRNIDQRYLWVDSLCIIQDSDECKEQYIPQMHRIYHTALVSIIAAVGEDATIGLPGISFARRPPSRPLRLGNRILEAKLPTLHTLMNMEDSKWNTRAWTYQEHAFSRKRIYFTSYQVYWTCPSRRASESGVDYAYKGIDLWDYGPLERDPGPDLNSRTGLYENLVKGYSSRTLSFHSDSLNAFAGLLSKLGDMFGWSFASALPEDLFDFAMLWVCPYGDLLRPRLSSRQTPDDSLCRSPTWCWTAWDGFVYWNPWRLNSFAGKAITLKSEIKYWITDGARFRKIADESSLGWQAHAPRHLIPTNPQDSTSPYIREASIPRHALVFSAQKISANSFTISAPDFGSKSAPATETASSYSHYFRSHLTDAGWIYDRAGRHCGTIRGIPFSAGNKSEANWELVLLSRCDQDEVVQTEIDACPNLPLEYPSCEEYYEEIFDTSTYHYKRWWILNVMLVDRKGTWVERVAVGQIHIDAWELVCGDRARETIVLS
ncbi:HET-domain-containing protein [Colletotrichum sublineola]|nr:HET-domain-containing protein [Colletotrichum sublineola]